MIVSLQSSLGIQFGKDHLLLVHLKKFLKEVSLDCHELIPQPSDITGDKLETYWVREISRFVKDNNIGRENVWAGFPLNEFLLHFMTLPFSAEENLREVIRYEMEKYIPFPEGEVCFDFVIMERDTETKKLRFLLLVIKKAVLEKYLSILDRAGTTPLGIEMSSISLLNFFLLGENGDTGKPTALVDIGKHGFELSWTSRGVLRYSRSVDFHTEADADQVRQIKEELRRG
ncbi:MAG: pilus assembly protein PilM, partial [Deltaproteobacteria bacterium]|nr:pilus assembly protein PilM [Deltaproteobacteria bacterium]